MKYRSWLIVPGNSEERLGSAVSLSADVIVVDLEGGVPSERKRQARATGAAWLQAHRPNVLEHRRFERWVRINSIELALAGDDLAAVMPGAPDGILLPRASGPDAVRELAAELYELESRFGIEPNSTRIIPVVGETARAAMAVGDYVDAVHQRLAGLSWNTHRLAASLSVSAPHAGQGEWGETFRYVRTQTLLAAHACSTLAIEAAQPADAESATVATAAERAMADGFSGMFLHASDQVAAVNAAFTPSPAQIAEARAIVAAFSATPDADSIALGNRVIDRPGLWLARRMVSMSPRHGQHDHFGLSNLRSA